MGETITKLRFIDALVTEHKASRAMRAKFGRELFPELLSIEVDCHRGAPVCRLIIRGTVEPMRWIIYETEHPTSPEGLRSAHHEAVDIVYDAVRQIANELNEQAGIGISSMKYYEGWFSEPHAASREEQR